MTAAREFVVVDDTAGLAHAAASRIVERMNENSERIAVCLTGGSTPKRLYELLATPRWRAQVPWTRTHWFIGDDRFVPEGDPNSNIGMARHAFLDACAAPGTVHPIPTDLDTPDAAARAYESSLHEFYGQATLAPARPLFDVVLMGIGPDGHTASLFPGDPATHETERWVVGVPQAHVAPFVPRVTLTFPTLASCREMLFLVSGADKRGIVDRALKDAALPAARARSQERTVWLMDRAAAPEPLDG
jgi:6-phosphogluconolactonase